MLKPCLCRAALACLWRAWNSVWNLVWHLVWNFAWNIAGNFAWNLGWKALWIFKRILYGILFVMILSYFLSFSGPVPLDFLCCFAFSIPCRYGICFFALCFSNKFFPYIFSMCFFLLAGRSFCCAPREPHGQEFSIDSRSGFSACQSQSACRAHGVSWALQRDLYPWPRGFSCVFILKFLGYSDLGSSFLLPRLHEF